MATITSKEENDHVYSILKESKLNSAYFGLYNKQNNWHWVTDEEVNYVNWAEGEPNDEKEKYGMFYYKYPDGTWNDGDFTDTVTQSGGHAFICELDK